jgi:hypothetical protein
VIIDATRFILGACAYTVYSGCSEPGVQRTERAKWPVPNYAR